MEKKQKAIIIVICTAVCLAVACRRLHDDDIIRLPQELKDYVMFPVGSYWVYQDSVSGQKDSMVLTNQQIIVKSGGHSFEGYYECLEQTFYSSLGGNLFCDANIINNNDPLLYTYNNGHGFFYAPFGNAYLIHFYLTPLDSITINNNTFVSVTVLTSNYSSSNRKYYWVNGIGLVRTEISEDTAVCNLINYQINN